MAEELKGLLEKINQEGIKKAEEKARVIESKAEDDARKILKDAREEAQKMVEEAEQRAKKMEENARISLKQAARDLVLSLKDEIRKIFDKLISTHTGRAVSDENLTLILGNLIEKYMEEKGKTSDIKVLLEKDDIDRLKDTFISALKSKLKDGIEFRPSPNINAGFSISFDKGKSFFDFTDEGLAEALCVYLNPELHNLLK